MNLNEMVTASAANINYFHPFEKNDLLYISGNNLAQVPAMFAALAVMEQKIVPQSSLRIISVEGTRQKADLIGEGASILDWAQRLNSLNQDGKMHTMNYMVETILE